MVCYVEHLEALGCLVTNTYAGSPLASSVDEGSSHERHELEEQKKKMKLLIRQINSSSATRASIKSGNYLQYYLIENDIIYFGLTSSNFSEKVVFLYLEDLAREFWTLHGKEALTIKKAYPYTGFDKYIQKTMKVYFTNPQANDNLQKLHNELKDVTNIMEKNIEDLLYRGDSLDRMQDLSSNLRAESKKYMKHAKRINLEALIRQYAPIAGISLIFLFLIWWIFLR